MYFRYRNTSFDIEYPVVVLQKGTATVPKPFTQMSPCLMIVYISVDIKGTVHNIFAPIIKHMFLLVHIPNFELRVIKKTRFVADIFIMLAIDLRCIYAKCTNRTHSLNGRCK